MKLTTYNILMLINAICWAITYILIIKANFSYKKCVMPTFSLATNIIWEVVFSFIYPHQVPQIYFDYIWLTLDVIIFMQLLFFNQINKRNLLLLLFFSFIFIVLCVYNGDKWGIYSALITNLIMSILFILEIIKSRSEGHSLAIGLTKMLGTAIACIAFYFYIPQMQNLFIIGMFIAILIFDIIYCMILAKYIKISNFIF
ncbi:MAG: hypothetical protein LW595_00795 [Rickettsiales bacterium]|nr:hypothetical protein [Rickettsiales bacterium]